jgi:hypothetical protein
MGTVQKSDNKVLGMITPTDAEEFLFEWANLSFDQSRAIERLKKHHPEILSTIDDYTLALLQGQLRMAWDAPDQRHRDWCLYQMRDYLYQSSAREEWLRQHDSTGRIASKQPAGYQFGPPPPITKLEAVLVYLQSRIGDRTKHCGYEDCPTPYFIAVKRWQKFCSEKCAGPGNREVKRKWWHEKGKFQ